MLILNEGRPRIIADIEPLAQGIVNILLPGNYGADALVNLLTGKSNFSGKLPYTYPREINSLANYDFKKSEAVKTMSGAYDYNARITQQWPFGYGLSYTTFKYSNLRVSKSQFAHGDEMEVSVDVIVACIGENSYTETPGNLTDLWLSENQRNLVKELAKTGKPVVLVLNEGRPRLIADIEPLAQGIICLLYTSPSPRD